MKIPPCITQNLIYVKDNIANTIPKKIILIIAGAAVTIKISPNIIHLAKRMWTASSMAPINNLAKRVAKDPRIAIAITIILIALTTLLIVYKKITEKDASTMPIEGPLGPIPTYQLKNRSGVDSDGEDDDAPILQHNDSFHLLTPEAQRNNQIVYLYCPIKVGVDENGKDITVFKHKEISKAVAKKANLANGGDLFALNNEQWNNTSRIRLIEAINSQYAKALEDAIEESDTEEEISENETESEELQRYNPNGMALTDILTSLKVPANIQTYVTQFHTALDIHDAKKEVIAKHYRAIESAKWPKKLQEEKKLLLQFLFNLHHIKQLEAKDNNS